ncbi:hypothetical protein RR46_14683 [Papilio xuthus]|uniref:Ig-like domain-containing protein n=1 Tax=Papilio xuthus TaxID=66420 RepID=A0A194PEQ7_PAPXU|nr:hypothetical protein RR46_14683 [Papilio xuthus]
MGAVKLSFRIFDNDGVQNILAFKNEAVPIQCQADMPISYCGFVHPSGKRFSSSSVTNAKCEVKINASDADVGEWKCHIGVQSVRVEMMKKIEVRVVGEVAAVQANVTSLHGKPVTLACVTTKGLVPLSYCRFEPPNGSPFSIDASVNATNPILNKYYFPANKSLDRGDCAVTIRKVRYEDVGQWTCGAGFDDGQEHIAQITVEVEGLYTMSTASVTGITLGGILVAGIIGILGYVAWKRRWVLGSRREEVEEIEVQEMGQQNPEATAQRRVPVITVQSPSTTGRSESTSP